MPFQLCASPLKGEVRRSCEPSASLHAILRSKCIRDITEHVGTAAADGEKRQICTCLFADSVGS